MNTLQLRAAGAGLFFLFIFLSGLWLSRLGKPYPGIPFNIHKFIALGAVVFLGLTVRQLSQGAPLSPLQIAAVVLTGLCFLATIITGGLTSIETPMPVIVPKLHLVLPFVTSLSSAAALYLILGKGN